MNQIRLKAEIDPLIEKIVASFTVELTEQEVRDILKKEYYKGLEKAEVEFGVNFYPDPKRADMLSKMTFENIKGMNEDVANKLRQELQRGMLNFESTEALRKRIKKVMDIGIERSRMIARTEVNRAANMGHIDGARQSGLKLKKRWDARLDNRTSPICTHLDGKTIGMDEKFKYNGVELDAPPAHPNCRSVLIFIEEGMEDVL